MFPFTVLGAGPKPVGVLMAEHGVHKCKLMDSPAGL